jgi:hypothetical protein
LKVHREQGLIADFLKVTRSNSCLSVLGRVRLLFGSLKVVVYKSQVTSHSKSSGVKGLVKIALHSALNSQRQKLVLGPAGPCPMLNNSPVAQYFGRTNNEQGELNKATYFFSVVTFFPTVLSASRHIAT